MIHAGRRESARCRAWTGAERDGLVARVAELESEHTVTGPMVAEGGS